MDIVDMRRYRDMRYGENPWLGRRCENVWKMPGKKSSRYVTICYRDILWRNWAKKGKNKRIVSLGKKVTVSYRLHTIPTIPYRQLILKENYNKRKFRAWNQTSKSLHLFTKKVLTKSS